MKSMKKTICLLLIIVTPMVYSQVKSPVIKATYKNIAMVNSTTNAVIGKVSDEFYIEILDDLMYYAEGGVKDTYKIINKKENRDSIIMQLKNSSNHSCRASFEIDKLIIRNKHTQKSIILTNPSYH